MKKKINALIVNLFCLSSVFSQTNIKSSTNLPELRKTPEISRERREQAFVKLLEGQRILWGLRNSRRRSPNDGDRAQLAGKSLKSAIELDPTLAEAHTALAELILNTTTSDIEEAILLTQTAVKINHDNFGGHLILARLYTIKSKFDRGGIDATFTEKAIGEWKEIARLDSRNAEAYAFLSELYRKTNKTPERIGALQNWLSATAPLEMRFYQTVMGGESDLSSESASLKLGEALLEIGKYKESIEILSRSIADNPENAPAVELLREAVQTADVNSSAVARQALTQAVYANQENVSLISLLAQIEAKAGNVDRAAKILNEFSAKFGDTDKISAAALQIALGDIYADSNQSNESVAAYENALKVRGVASETVVGDRERDFTIRALEKIIQVYKGANRPVDVELSIERARLLLGKQDLFPDRQLIMFYRETGKTSAALGAIRRMRVKNADDYGLLRLEATVLTESGKVDEAVALISPLLSGKTAPSNGVRVVEQANSSITAPKYDDFTNYIFISNLYSQAKRGKEAIEAANQAVSSGRSDEKKQIAKLTLATAQQTAGNFAAAENILRELLKQSPGNPFALNNLGYFLIERDAKLDEALNLIEQAVKIDPTNPSYLDSFGWAYFKLGDFTQAEKYLKEALRNDHSSATISEHLGDVYAKQGKLEPAKSAWRKSLDVSFEIEQTNRLKSKLRTAGKKY